MRLSIIIPSFNQGNYIDAAIRSIIQQNYHDIEIIVVDGKSTDNTLEVLKKYGTKVKWVSEKDEGQADALNKGLAMATGEVIGWINSDDYYEANVFQDVIREFQEIEMQWVIGNITIQYDQLEYRSREITPLVTYENLKRNPDIVRQQGAFYRKSFLHAIGGWNKRYHMVMDYDLWIRLSRLSQPKMVSKHWAVFRIQPMQKTTGKNLLLQTAEIAEILRREGVPFLQRAGILGRKSLYLMKYYLKGLLISVGLLDERYRNLSYSLTNKLYNH